MARKAKGPWFWKARGQFYATVKGKQIPLGTDEAAATRQWHILEATAASHKTGDDKPFMAAAEAFLDWIHRNKKDKTYNIYLLNLSAFCRVPGAVRVADLRPFHVDEALKLHPDWSKATRRAFMTVINTALNWGVKQGLTNTNPLHRRLDIPAITSRGQEACITPDDYEAILAHANDSLREFVIACRNTGTRPHMVVSVTAADFHEAASCWVLDSHETDKDGQPLQI